MSIDLGGEFIKIAIVKVILFSNNYNKYNQTADSYNKEKTNTKK